MRRRKKKNKIYYFLILAIFLGISTGYAALSTDPKVTTSTKVEKTTWDIKFENIKVKTGSINAVAPTINNSTGEVSFQSILINPGEYFEFTLDIRNYGTIDAMINSIPNTNGLTDTQKKYLNYTITYENGQVIKSRDIIEKQSFVRLKVRVEYRTDIVPANLPSTTEVINLSFKINYAQNDGKGRNVPDNGVMYLIANGDVNTVGTIVTIGTEKFYTIGIEGDNVRMIAMHNIYVGSECSGTNCTPYVTDVTGMQDENMQGYIAGQYITQGGTAFSNDYQKGSKYSNYTGSLVQGYISNYKILLERNFGIEVVEAGALDYYDITDQTIFACTSEADCAAKYPWLFSTSYWGINAYSDTAVFGVLSIGDYGGYSYTEERLGVRPVILVKKSYFK